MADLKNKLFNYLAQRHFDLMSPEQRARFDDYAKNEDFQGNMKHWYQNYKDSSTPDLANDIGTGENLTGDEWNNLYDAYQEVFQRMNDAKDPEIGFASDYNKPVKDFIKDWFGPGKVFVPSQARSTIDLMLFQDGYDPATTPPTHAPTRNLADFLDDATNKAALKPIFTNKNNSTLKEVFSTITYEDFVKGLRNQQYNSDTKFREKLETVIYYISQKMPKPGYDKPDPTEWPANIGYTTSRNGEVRTIDPILQNIFNHRDTSEWFHVQTPNIQGFKDNYTKIFDVLLTNSKIREKFLAQAGGNSIVTEPLLEAIKQTDYENKDSKDYLPPKYEDTKNWKQWLEDKLHDTYEDYFRKFVNPSRGTRIYFSPWSQDIIKAFDKEKIKPTDGLEGILAKKDNIDKNLKTKTPKDHFKWFTDTLEKLQTGGKKKTVEGALRNGKQMRELASEIIAEAVLTTPAKIKEAKTALEILSVAKYGLMSSRTFSKIREATKNMTIVSDPKLSWNNNKGVAAISKVVDNMAGAMIQGTAAIAMAAHNFIQHRRTKINKHITQNKILDAAYKKWDEKDVEEEIRKAPDQLAELAAGRGKSHLAINTGNIAAMKTTRDAMAPGPAKENLSQDIALFERATRNQANSTAELDAIHRRQSARGAGSTDKDPIQELVSYWNMLETTTKTHAFTLGSMSVKRRDFLNGFTQNISEAQTTANAYRRNHGGLSYAA